jgi:hypothetical protein
VFRKSNWNREVRLRRDTCAIAFKEWAGVCDALTRGDQAIIVRKGGISEARGPGIFVPEHDEFWLYPTGVHQAQQGLRTAAAPGPLIDDGSVSIRALARVERVGFVRDEATLPALEEFHVLNEETVRQRFRYRNPGLWVLAARIWRREPAFAIMATMQHAGCKTWVTLDEALPTAGLVPALGDDSWAACLARLSAILDRQSR